VCDGPGFGEPVAIDDGDSEHALQFIQKSGCAGGAAAADEPQRAAPEFKGVCFGKLENRSLQSGTRHVPGRPKFVEPRHKLAGLEARDAHHAPAAKQLGHRKCVPDHVVQRHDAEVAIRRVDLKPARHIHTNRVDVGVRQGDDFRGTGGGGGLKDKRSVGWRTARLCAHETYMDCPYYEQLQYVGDTRVQCLVSLFDSGDARLMRNAIEQSSERIVEYGDEHKEARGLGSTITAALVVEGQAFIANVGDSRTYLLRDGKLTRITSDHSLVERLVQAGQIDREDVYDHPSRNLIYRSLGAGRAEVDVDIFTERLQPGDALLLCSDGLWEMVHDPQLTNILTEVDDLNETVNLLIQRANENGGEDNITAVLVRGVAG